MKIKKLKTIGFQQSDAEKIICALQDHPEGLTYPQLCKITGVSSGAAICAVSAIGCGRLYFKPNTGNDPDDDVLCLKTPADSRTGDCSSIEVLGVYGPQKALPFFG